MAFDQQNQIRSTNYSPNQQRDNSNPRYPSPSSNVPRPYNNDRNNNGPRNYEQRSDQAPRQYNNRPPQNNDNRYPNNNFRPHNQEPTPRRRFDIRYFPYNFSEIKTCDDETLLGWYRFLPTEGYTPFQEKLLHAIVDECKYRFFLDV